VSLAHGGGYLRGGISSIGPRTKARMSRMPRIAVARKVVGREERRRPPRGGWGETGRERGRERKREDS